MLPSAKVDRSMEKNVKVVSNRSFMNQFEEINVPADDEDDNLSYGNYSANDSVLNENVPDMVTCTFITFLSIIFYM